MSHIQKVVCFFATTFCIAASWGQNSQTIELSDKILDECEKYYENQETKSATINHQQIILKFNDAEHYLHGMLNQMILVDTTTYYLEQIEKLNKLNREFDIALTKDENIIKEFEHQYLLLSLIRVTSCGEYFQKLIELYFAQDFSGQICDEYDAYRLSYSHDNIKCVLSEAALLYKPWLYDMLIARFKDELHGFSRSKSLTYYNWISLYIGAPFDGNIAQDEMQLKKLEPWSTVAIEGHHLSGFANRADLLSQMYLIRASKVSDWNSKIQIDTVYQYNEKLLLLASNHKPQKPEIKYSLGVLYYNRSIHLTQQSETTKNAELVEKLKEEASSLRKKGTSLIDEATKKMQTGK